MTVITFTGRTKRPGTAAPPPAAPAAVTGSFGSPSGRTGTFVGSYRLERVPVTVRPARGRWCVHW